MKTSRPKQLFRETVTMQPENQSSPVRWITDWMTPDDLWYRRNHFAYPAPNMDSLQVVGAVHRPLTLSCEEIRSRPAKSVVAVMECAGNRRTMFRPRVYGVPWNEGAISQAEWTGIPLRDLLREAGICSTAREVVFWGMDGEGEEKGPFARSLSLGKSLHPDTLVAYAQNGRLLSPEHGAPLRLIVPGWYAMASVKWLRRIEVVTEPFQGYYQKEDYHYYPFPDSDEGKRPVTVLRVNSLIRYPHDFSVLKTGHHRVEGLAWTGKGVIRRVEVSVDRGAHWHPARLHQRPWDHPYAWVQWSWNWEALQPGKYEIWSRAADTAGRMQPLRAKWNRKGYGYNAVCRSRVQVEWDGSIRWEEEHHSTPNS